MEVGVKMVGLIGGSTWLLPRGTRDTGDHPMKRFVATLPLLTLTLLLVTGCSESGAPTDGGGGSDDSGGGLLKVSGKEAEPGNYIVLGTLTDQFDRAQAKANVEDTLARHSDIAAMVGLFAYNPPAILEALQQADRLGEDQAVQVIAFDEADETLQGIKDGTVYGLSLIHI